MSCKAVFPAWSVDLTFLYQKYFAISAPFPTARGGLMRYYVHIHPHPVILLLR